MSLDLTIVAFVLLFPIVVGWWGSRCCCRGLVGRPVSVRRHMSAVGYTDTATGVQGGAIYHVLYLKHVGHIVTVQVGTPFAAPPVAAATAPAVPCVIVQAPTNLGDTVVRAHPLGLPPSIAMVATGTGYAGMAYLHPSGRVVIVPGPSSAPGASLAGATIVFPLVPETVV
jgi:hypothetical protein